MIRGINASKLGMAVEQLRTDVLANNLANINTAGFKRSAAASGEFARMLVQRQEDATDVTEPIIGTLGNGAQVVQVMTFDHQGDITETGRALDLAIEGPGAFLALRPDGSLLQTRNGAFQQMADGSITTAEGFPVLIEGLAGGRMPLVALGAQPEFQPDGMVLVDGQPVGRLAMEGAAPETRLHVRSLEASNVDLAQEMSEVIMALRSYQVNQRALQVQDETLGRAVTEIGKV